jgi:hypothetical protein
VREDAPELGRIAFHLDQCATEYGLLLSLGERLLEQSAEAVLLPLDPQEILNLLPRPRLGSPRSEADDVGSLRRNGAGHASGMVIHVNHGEVVEGRSPSCIPA